MLEDSGGRKRRRRVTGRGSRVTARACAKPRRRRLTLLQRELGPWPLGRAAGVGGQEASSPRTGGAPSR